MVNITTWVFHVKWKLSQKTVGFKHWPYIIHEAVRSTLCVRWLFDGEYSITLHRWFPMMGVVELSLVRQHWQSFHSLYTSECVPVFLKEHINSHFCLYTPPFCWLISAICLKTVEYLLAGKATAESWQTVVSHIGTNFLQIAECMPDHVFCVCFVASIQEDNF